MRFFDTRFACIQQRATSHRQTGVVADSWKQGEATVAFTEGFEGMVIHRSKQSFRVRTISGAGLPCGLRDGGLAFIGQTNRANPEGTIGL